MSEALLQGKFIFMGARQFNRDNGKSLTFAKLGNVEKMENYEFIVDPQKCNINHNLNSPVIPKFEIGLYNGRPTLNLLDITASK